MTDPYTEARNASAGMPGHSMSADVGVREAGGDKLREALASMLGEQGVWADGQSVLTCGSTTGHSVKAIAFCESADIAAIIAAALNAPTESVKAPEGWVLVPVQVTDAMAAEYQRTSWSDAHYSQEVWSAMLAASPTPITADDAVAKERERAAWHDGFNSARLCLTDDEAFCLTEDVEHDAWCDSATAIRSLSPDTEGEGM